MGSAPNQGDFTGPQLLVLFAAVFLTLAGSCAVAHVVGGRGRWTWLWGFLGCVGIAFALALRSYVLSRYRVEAPCAACSTGTVAFDGRDLGKPVRCAQCGGWGIYSVGVRADS